MGKHELNEVEDGKYLVMGKVSNSVVFPYKINTEYGSFSVPTTASLAECRDYLLDNPELQLTIYRLTEVNI